MSTCRAALFHVLCLVSLSAAVGCSRKIPEPEPVQQPTVVAPPKPAEPKPAATPEVVIPKAGWQFVTRQNRLPLCAFSSANEREKVKAVEQVTSQVFQADRPVMFGAFPPYCINPACDEVSTLQCSVERSGNILRLQTRYAGSHKDGARCTDGCRELTAGCETPVLEAGKYTVEYGSASIELTIPSALKTPCFKPR